MRDQQTIAERAGVRARSINSANTELAGDERAIAANEVDLLIVSPERLSNHPPRTNTGHRRTRDRAVRRRRGALHLGLGARLPARLPPYREHRHAAAGQCSGPATTATANDRVVADIASQLGTEPRRPRGPLARQPPAARRSAGPTRRSAWLARRATRGTAGSGIVYCLTIADCERLRRGSGGHRPRLPRRPRVRGPPAARRRLAEMRSRRWWRPSLSDGLRQTDLGFVVHFQRPGSVVAYYQQVGRAGRAARTRRRDPARRREDDEIAHYFIRTAFPPEAH